MLFILMVLFMLIGTSKSVPVTINYTLWDCYDSSDSPLGKSSNQTTINQLLSTLVSKISTAKNGFVTYNLNTSQNLDPRFGFALCRGDLNPDDCQDCVKMASDEVVGTCPRARQAVLWKEQCMIRYDNHSIFTVLEENPYKMRYNNNTVTDHVQDWIKLLKETLNEVISMASTNTSSNRFATKGAWFSPMNKTLYTLAQCNPDLTAENCAKCFSVARSEFYDITQRGGIVLSPSCTLRYEVYPFYRISNMAPSPFSGLAPPPHSIGTITTGGRKKKRITTKVVVAIVVPLAALGMLIALSTYLFRKKVKRYPSQDVSNGNHIIKL